MFRFGVSSESTVGAAYRNEFGLRILRLERNWYRMSDLPSPVLSTFR